MSKNLLHFKKNEFDAEPMEYKHTNDLIHTSSPYLLQHAHNPVNWHAWEESILKKANEENKLLLVSIGYSACHWCHVMEDESFSDEEVASFMNEHFICIKVDREERPDVDQIYMNASLLLNGSGGWPLNAFAVPDGRPFYVLTYLPRAQWLSVLQQIVNLYKNEKGKIENQATALTEGVQKKPLLKEAADHTKEMLKEIYGTLWEHVSQSIDTRRGGFGKSPKFPMPVVWNFLIQDAYMTGNKEALTAATTTLDHMAKGGIYDQLGGGFARYSVDANWHVPHFEKMLYDNAQLVSLYANAFQYTRNPLYEKVIRETLGFIQLELTHPDGGFYSALNADSEGEEGRFYVWNVLEVESVLKQKDAELFLAYYQMTAEGNWEDGKNILHAPLSDDLFAKKWSLDVRVLHEKLEQIKKLLLKKRNRRVPPSKDDKMLTSWNALMIKGYTDAYRALGDEDYLETALHHAHFIFQNVMDEDGKLFRCYKKGKAFIGCMLEDYACLADACIHLYQMTFDIQWLNKAKKLADYANLHFKDQETGLFYYTSDLSDALIARKIEVEDNVMPSSNAVMAHVLYFLGRYFDENTYLRQSQKMLYLMLPDIPASVPYFSCWAKLLGWMQTENTEVVITGENYRSVNRFLQHYYLPNVLFLGGSEESLPLLKGKIQKNTVLYVCRNKTCLAPTSDRYAVLKQCMLPNDEGIKKDYGI